jgi:hypothetical protein
MNDALSISHNDCWLCTGSAGLLSKPGNRPNSGSEWSLELPHSVNPTCRIRDPAVSSPEYYPTPAPNADVIRKPLLAGRHLIILNRSGRSMWVTERMLHDQRPLVTWSGFPGHSS